MYQGFTIYTPNDNMGFRAHFPVISIIILFQLWQSIKCRGGPKTITYIFVNKKMCRLILIAYWRGILLVARVSRSYKIL